MSGVVEEARGAAMARATPEDRPAFEAQVGLAWLNRLGVITLILGVAFAFKTAVDNNWIGPTARVGLGVAAALLALVVGDVQWRRQHRVFAQGLTALGMAMMYLAWWAAFALYALIPQPVAFALMVGTTVGSGALALRYAAQPIAVLALLGGYVTPIALATGTPHALIFLGYVALLNAGAIVLARRRVWPALELLTTIATVFLYCGWLVTSTSADHAIGLFFAAIFYVQLAIARERWPWVLAQPSVTLLVPTLIDGTGAQLIGFLVCAAAGMVIAVRRRGSAATWTAACLWTALLATAADQALLPALLAASLAFVGLLSWTLWAQVRRRRPVTPWDLALMLGNPAAYLGLAMIALQPFHQRWVGVIAVIVAAVYAGLARALQRAQVTRTTLAAVLGVALVFVNLAIPLELAGAWLAIAWSAEAAALAWLAARRREPLPSAPGGPSEPLPSTPGGPREPLPSAPGGPREPLPSAPGGPSEPLPSTPGGPSASAPGGPSASAPGGPREPLPSAPGGPSASAPDGPSEPSPSASRSSLLLAATGVIYALALTATLRAAVALALHAELTAFLNLRLLAFAALIASLFAGGRQLRAAPAASVFAGGRQLRAAPAASVFADDRLGAAQAARWSAVVGHVLVVVALGIEIVTWIEHAVALDAIDNATTVALTTLIASYAVFLVILGVVRRRARDRVLGLAMLAVAIAKLYLVDVWSLGRGFQVAAFLALGALLLGVSYLYSRYRHVVGRLWTDRRD